MKRSGSSKQVRERKLFEPMTNLWGAADRQPVCTACPAGASLSPELVAESRRNETGERGRKA